MSEFEFKQTLKDKTLFLEISGPLSEQAQLPADLHLSGVQEVYIDLAKLEYINSFGIKEWSIWIEGIAQNLKEWNLHFVNCTNMFIEAANLTRILIPKGTIIDSFYVPYYCPETQETITVKAERGNNFEEARGDKASWFDFPEEIERDGNTYEIDVLPIHYFGFLKRVT